LFLRGAAGSEIKGVVRIIPESKYPFRIENTVIDTPLSGKVTVSHKIDNDIYILEVSNLVKDNERYIGRIILKTDNPLHPKLTVYVIGQIEKQ